jgi:hypothetical protein
MWRYNKMKNSLKFFFTLLSLTLIILSSSTKIKAQEPKRNIGIGIGYPYISLKHRIFKKISMEIRFAMGNKIDAFSIRSYYNWLPLKKQILFSGLEFGYFTFNKEELKGDGFFQMLYTGFEIFPKEWFSIICDIGATFITTETYFLDRTLRVNGVEWVLNMGVCFYYSTKKDKSKKLP